jgi:hypothetical protein
MREQLGARKVTTAWKSRNPLICIGVGTGAHLRQEEMEPRGYCMVAIVGDCLRAQPGWTSDRRFAACCSGMKDGEREKD